MRPSNVLALVLTIAAVVAATAGQARAASAPGRITVPLGSIVPFDAPTGFSAGVIRPDGAAIVAAPQDGNRVRLAAVRPDGALDPAFGAGGIADVPLAQGFGSPAAELVLRPDGRLVIAVSGPFVTNEPSRVRLLGLTAAGAPDPAFHDGTPLDAPVGLSGRAHALAPDRGIVVSGYQVQPDRWALTRITPAGEVDAGFGTGGVTTLPEEHARGVAVTVAAGGAIDAIGEVTRTYDRPRYLRRLTATGATDPAFAGGRAIPLGYGGSSGARERPDGSLDVVTGAAQTYVNRYRADGTLDSSFGEGGGVALPTEYGLQLSALDTVGGTLLAGPDGQDVVVRPPRGNQARDPALRVARLAAGGSLTSDTAVTPAFGGGFFPDEQGFATKPSVLDQTAAYLLPVGTRADGGLLLAGGVGVGESGKYGIFRLVEDGALAALTPADQPDLAFGAPASAAPTLSLTLPARPVLRAGDGSFAWVRLQASTSGLGLVHYRAQVAGQTVASTVLDSTTTAPRLLVGPESIRVLRRHPRATVVLTARFRDLLGRDATATARAPLRPR